MLAMDNDTIATKTLSVIVATTPTMLAIEDLQVPAYNEFWVRLVLCSITLMLFFAIKIDSWIPSVKKDSRNMLPSPPGPKGFPLLGYVPFIGEKAHETFAQLAYKFGPIFRIYLGSQPVVILTDYKLIRDAMKSKTFVERPNLRMLSQVIQDYGVVNVNGDKWRVQRQFVMKAMREMGLAKTGPNRKRAESMISVIIEDMLEEIKRANGASVDLSCHISECIGRILMKTLWNFELPVGDEGLKANIIRAEAGFKTSLTNLVNYFPILALSSEVRQDLKFVKNSHRETHEFFRKLINDYRQEDQSTSTMIDWFTTMMEENKTYYDETQLLSILSELFSAGLETTKTTLLWMFLYVCLNPDVQKQVHEEIDSVVGRERKPELEDMASLPYTNAVILETQRIASIVPSGLIHVATDDTNVGGFHIAKGTEIIGHQWTLHHDPALWKSPNTFDPTNFLDDNDGSLVKPPYFIPFSTGRRMCLGHELAMKDLFLIFTSLMHTFSLTFDDNEPVPSIEPVIGFTLTPQQYKIVADVRQ